MTEPRHEAIPNEPATEEDRAWGALLEWRRDAAAPVADSPLYALYGPLCSAHRKRTLAVGHLAQSLDGRIATASGVSQWLSGAEDLLHTHRMRALADAVVVGVNTVLHDNPQLTVRRCAGTHPLRVVIDPERRLDGSQRVFRDETAPTLLLAAADRARTGEAFGHAEVVPVPRCEWGLDPHEIRRILARRGITWLFIEGGGITVSRFLAARALDRLQLTVAPVILGSGRSSILLPELADLTDSLRPRTRRFIFGNDIMVECDFDE
jgi:diaminohydroxyphosphoribosylaminopyrimidine deaminase/5-amino-6-(5-phosphoribosylamino)uracil reductase